MKYSISICSNSLDRKIKFLGVISFLKALPICAIPNGICAYVQGSDCVRMRLRWRRRDKKMKKWVKSLKIGQENKRQ